MKPPTPHTAKQDEQLERLRALLLQNDRAELEKLRSIIEQKGELAKRVDPIIEDHLEELRANFPDSYHRVIQRIIDVRLQQKQDELINIIYPRLGILIRKFIANEIKLLRERIDHQIQQSPFAFLRRNRKNTSAEILANTLESSIEEVYVISHESGLLLGSASAQTTVDKEMIAGMLTAIKAFVEDAFQRTDEELQGIQYGSYEILIQNFYNYYIAVAISGSINETERDLLTQNIMEFAAKELNRDLQEPSPDVYYHLQQQLTVYFITPFQRKQV